MDKNQLLTIVAVSVAVALITSLLTVSLTGQSIFDRFIGDRDAEAVRPYTSSCSGASCTLYEDSKASLDYYGTRFDISIDFIDSKSVTLNINGEITNRLDEGDAYVPNSVRPTRLVVMDIRYSSKDTIPSSVVLRLESVNTSSEDVTYQGVLEMLNKNCIVVDHGLSGNVAISKNCDQICKVWENRTCIGGLLNRNPSQPEFARPILCSESFIPTNNDPVAGMSCICCSS